MKLLKYASLFGSIALLCGALAGARQASAAINVACCGDSITYGVNLSGAGTATGQTWPADLQAMLGAGYNVSNFGYPGLSLMSVNPQPPSHPAYTSTSQYQSAISSSPNIVIIMLGTNDASFAPASGQTWDQTYDTTFKTQYQQLIRNFQNLPTHPKVYVCYPAHCFGSNQYGIDPNIVDNSLPGLINQLVAGVSGVGIINCNRAVEGMGVDFGDNVHPDANGAKALADMVYNTVDPNTGGPIANGTYTMTPLNATGSRLDGTSWSISNGANLQIWQASGGDNQRWVISNIGANKYKIQPSYAMDQTIDVTNGGPANGALLQLWFDYQGSANQSWTFTSVSGGYTITPACQTAARMDVQGPSSANGTKIQIWTATGQSNQTWALTSAP